MIGALMFLGCPLRMVIRIGGGDWNALVGLVGFISGILASNHDVTDIFIDSALKICHNDIPSFETFLTEVDTLLRTHTVNCVITSSLAVEEATDVMKKFM